MREKKKKLLHGSSLDVLIRDKLKKEKDKRSCVNWEERKNGWLSKIDNLYNDIDSWFRPFDGDIKVERQEIEINEEYIGSYNAPKMKIKVGAEHVTLTPRATLIIGGYGRVDMAGLDGEAMLLLLPKKDVKKASIESCAWYIATRSSRHDPIPLDENTFASALESIMKK